MASLWSGVGVKRGKWSCFYGRAGGKNEARSLRNQKDLEMLGLGEDSGGWAEQWHPPTGPEEVGTKNLDDVEARREQDVVLHLPRGEDERDALDGQHVVE